MENHLKNIRTFLAGGGDPNHRDQFQDTLLHLSPKVRNGVQIVVELVNAGADVNSLNFLLQTPLHIAVNHRNRSVINALIYFGALVNSQDCRGNSILHSAINACATMDEDWNCKNPHCPHRAPDMGIIRKLLEHEGIDVNIENKEGYTPLLWAVKDKNFEIVKELLEKSAIVNVGNYRYETPLHAALSYPKPNLDIARELLRCGASIACVDIKFQTPFDFVFTRVKDNESFAMELVKLITFHDKNNDLIISPPRMNSKLRKLHKSCIEEIEKMREEIIGEISLYDLIFYRMYDITSAPNEIVKGTLKILNSGRYEVYSDLILKYVLNSRS